MNTTHCNSTSLQNTMPDSWFIKAQLPIAQLITIQTEAPKSQGHNTTENITHIQCAKLHKFYSVYGLYATCVSVIINCIHSSASPLYKMSTDTFFVCCLVEIIAFLFFFFFFLRKVLQCIKWCVNCLATCLSVKAVQ